MRDGTSLAFIVHRGVDHRALVGQGTDLARKWRFAWREISHASPESLSPAGGSAGSRILPDHGRAFLGDHGPPIRPIGRQKGSLDDQGALPHAATLG